MWLNCWYLIFLRFFRINIYIFNFLHFLSMIKTFLMYILQSVYANYMHTVMEDSCIVHEIMQSHYIKWEFCFLWVIAIITLNGHQLCQFISHLVGNLIAGRPKTECVMVRTGWDTGGFWFQRDKNILSQINEDKLAFKNNWSLWLLTTIEDSSLNSL